MNIVVGKSYHIKDEFFSLVDDKYLMNNKEDGHYRPHFFCFADPHTEGIFWAVPQSSRVEKYRNIMKRKIEKYRKCNTIVIGNFGGKDNAFLIQNMFPIIEKYVDHEHTAGGLSVNIHNALCELIVSNAKEVLSYYNCGHNIIFPNITKIYELMKKELMV